MTSDIFIYQNFRDLVPSSNSCVGPFASVPSSYLEATSGQLIELHWKRHRKLEVEVEQMNVVLLYRINMIAFCFYLSKI